MDFDSLKVAIVEFVRHNDAWAIPVVFLLAFGECLAFVSLLLPATVILFAIGGLLGASGLTLWPVWVAGCVGSALGYSVSYWVGLIYKDRIAGVWPFSAHPEMLPKGRSFFNKYGASGVFVGHFFGPLRAVVPIVAGMCAMRHLHFQLANISASVLWATGLLLPGTFGVKWLFGT